MDSRCQLGCASFKKNGESLGNLAATCAYRIAPDRHRKVTHLTYTKQVRNVVPT